METHLDSLRNQFNRGDRLKFVFFWGHTSKDSSIGKECLSQWYSAPFEIDGRRYSTAEHFMMAEKARLFGSQDIRTKIIAADSPGAAKALGRRVPGFDEAEWIKHRFAIVVTANMAKFAQNAELGAFLISTGKRVLVEASPSDRIWGIGLSQQEPECANPNQWRGLNLLGFALMEVRERLTTDKQG